MSNTLTTTDRTASTALAASARRDLSTQLDTIERIAKERDWHIAKFYCMVLVLREEAEREEAERGEVFSHGENKPPFSVPRGNKSCGRPQKATDLKVIFAACGIEENRLQSAYRWHAKGEAMHAVYAQAVGKTFAKAMPMAQLVNTPATELPEEARKKQQMFFDFVSAPAAKARNRLGGARTNDAGSGSGSGVDYDPNAPVENARDLILNPLRDVARRFHEKEAKLPRFAHLPVTELAEMDGLLLDMREQLKDVLRK